MPKKASPLDIIFPSREPYWTRVEPTDRQLWAIGLICVEWAQLESLMEICIGILGGAAYQEEFKRSPSFKERLGLWRSLVERKITEPWRAQLLALIQSTSGMQQERDRIIHGTWGRDDFQMSIMPTDKIDVFKMSGPKRPFQWTLTYAQLRAIARKLDALNKAHFELFLNAAGRPKNFLLSDALKHISLPQDQTETPP